MFFQVYLISGGTIKLANKMNSYLNNDYEIHLNDQSTIEEINDEDNKLPPVNLNLIKINEIRQKHINKKIDIVGIIIEIKKPVKLKINSKDISIRDVTIIDESNTQITVTCWEEMVS